MSCDPTSSFRARGTILSGQAALARLVREQPATVADHYHDEIAAGADVICALTADTMTRVLAEIGMGFRAAVLTSSAIDLALDAAELTPRPLAVAGVLGASGPRSSSGVFPMGTGNENEIGPPPGADKLAEDYAMHAARLAAAGCELIVARGLRADLNKSLARFARRAAVVSASSTQLPTWAIVEVEPTGFTPDGETLEDASRSAMDAGAQAVLFEVTSPEVALALVDRLRMAPTGRAFGVVPGDPDEAPEAWATAAKRLLESGARILGGGARTTTRHLQALASLAHRGEASVWPRAL
jgi:S-methylmethionine-dependent homocysteine/selenocysteine methylase